MKLTGKPLEVAQELLALKRTDRNAVMDELSQKIRGYPRPTVLCEFSPALLWSKHSVNLHTHFFMEPVGYAGRDWSATNMVVGGMLCYPCSFKRREIRLYAGRPEDAQRLAAITRGSDAPFPAGGVRERRGQSDVRKLPGDMEIIHVELPTPEHAVQRDDARALLELVNGRQLPCASWKVPWDIAATEAFMLEAELVGPIEEFESMDLIAVYLGTLVAPPLNEMKRA